MSKNEINSDFVVVHSWMVKDLHLSGNELLVYAVIYGFSRDGCSSFYGSADYLADLTGMSRRSVFNCLKKLVGQNILIKNIFEQNNVVKTSYQSNLHLVQNLHSGSAKSALGVVQNLHSGSAKSAPNNIYNKKENHKIDDNKERVRAGNFSVDLLTDVGITEIVANDFAELRKRLKAPITKTAVDGLQREAQKAGMTLEDVLITMCANGWRGFKSEWVKSKGLPDKKSLYEQNMEASERAKKLIFGDAA